MFEERRNRPETLAQAGPGATQPAGPGGPHWRRLLEARWQALLREVTELCLAYHAAEAADTQDRGLLCRTIAARRKLADVEEALDRLSAGTFGRCEQCHMPIPVALLAVSPERRYCPRCAADGPAVAGPALTGHSSRR